MVDVNVDNSKANGSAKRPRGPSRAQQLSKIYSLPVPVRTFPLPTFNPSNPISLFHLVYTWAFQILSPPKSVSEPYFGLYSPETRSVHVTHPSTVRALWEQGFYGKGSLSRSEPSWLDREKRRRGTKANATSEENTRKRRSERQQVKWERARKEREAIDQKLEEERVLAEASRSLSPSPERNLVDQRRLSDATKMLTPSPSPSPEVLPSVITDSVLPLSLEEFIAPVGPLQLLALPNTILDYTSSKKNVCSQSTSSLEMTLASTKLSTMAPVGPLELLALPNSRHMLPLEMGNGSMDPIIRDSHKQLVKESVDALNGSELPYTSVTPTDESLDGFLPEKLSSQQINGPTIQPNDAVVIPDASISGPTTPSPKRRKSVRFSPTVEKTTYLQNDPPSPDLGASSSASKEEPLVIRDQEHLQLSPEETFFLNYGLGVLQVIDPGNGKPYTTRDLFTLLRQASYFQPQPNLQLSPDDPFLVNYVVYHHFRSLGWVVRAGTKFSVDFLLYNRGPPFSHAEFAILVLPSYSDKYWTSSSSLKKHVAGKEKRTWPWLHAVNRVNTQVKKTVILCYVDIPPPLDSAVESKTSIDGILKRYGVREIVIKRWVSNRSRD